MSVVLEALGLTVMGRNLGVVPCGKVRVAERRSTGEATDKGATQLQWRPQYFGDVTIMG